MGYLPLRPARTTRKDRDLNSQNSQNQHVGPQEANLGLEDATEIASYPFLLDVWGHGRMMRPARAGKSSDVQIQMKGTLKQWCECME